MGKIIQFPRKYDELRTLHPKALDELTERLSRIRDSLVKINQVMAEIKKRSDEEEQKHD